MKEASGELNMTIVTVVAIALILAFATIFVPDILEGIRERWNVVDENSDANDAWNEGQQAANNNG